MGIYLPNMEMPEDGVYFCEVGVIDGVGTITFHTEERQVFHLVEVPPHGDLIDRDALKENGELVNEDMGLYNYQGISMDSINFARVIIEAEE